MTYAAGLGRQTVPCPAEPRSKPLPHQRRAQVEPGAEALVLCRDVDVVREQRLPVQLTCQRVEAQEARSLAACDEELRLRRAERLEKPPKDVTLLLSELSHRRTPA